MNSREIYWEGRGWTSEMESGREGSEGGSRVEVGGRGAWRPVRPGVAGSLGIGVPASDCEVAA